MTQSDNAMRDWALWYAGQGLRVFPVKCRGKAPLTQHGCRDATTDTRQITEWWSRWPDANIGIAAGAPLVVLDVDIDHDAGKYGDETLEGLVQQYGPLPETWLCLTGGGGLHYYFRCNDPNITVGAGVLPGLDFRGTGGYVVAPPSLHESGNRYIWEASGDPADGVAPAELPAWLHDLLTKGGQRTGNKPQEIPERVAQGGRNQEMFRLACSFRAKGLTVEEITAAVMMVNETRCDPPLTSAEIETICRSAGRYERGTPAQRPTPAEAFGKADGPSVKPILTPMSAVEAREASYLISPYLPRGMLAIMGGVSGAGKTYLVLSWAAAISNGQRLPFQDWTSPTPPAGYVYYFTQENDPNTVIRPRLDLLGANLDKILIQASSGTVYDPLTLNDPRLEDAAKEYPPAMVIFDPIQSYLGAGVDMNKAERVRPVLDWLGDYAKRHNCTVVLVSHMSKPGMGNTSALDRLLGSSDFRNAARSIIVVGRDPDNKASRVFAHGKNSIGEPGDSQRYHIDGRQGVVYDGSCDLSADDIVKQAEVKTRNKPAVTLTAAMNKLEELLGPDGFATLEQVETMQTLEGIAKSTLYSARKELALQSVSIGQPPDRKTWWLRSDVDAEKFKFEHTPPPEQMKIST